MKVSETRCDICEESISGGLWARFRRKYRVRLLEWGMVDIAPVTDGWRRKRFDVCEDCWPELIDEVRERVTDDAWAPEDGAGYIPTEEGGASATGPCGDDRVVCWRCGAVTDDGLCEDCAGGAEVH